MTQSQIVPKTSEHQRLQKPNANSWQTGAATTTGQSIEATHSLDVNHSNVTSVTAFISAQID